MTWSNHFCDTIFTSNSKHRPNCILERDGKSIRFESCALCVCHTIKKQLPTVKCEYNQFISTNIFSGWDFEIQLLINVQCLRIQSNKGYLPKIVTNVWRTQSQSPHIPHIINKQHPKMELEKGFPLQSHISKKKFIKFVVLVIGVHTCFREYPSESNWRWRRKKREEIMNWKSIRLPKIKQNRLLFISIWMSCNNNSMP